jgi:hypothetical protein
MQGKFMKTQGGDVGHGRLAAWCRGPLAAAATACLLLQASLASAQVDLSGTWSSVEGEDAAIRTGGPDYADYTGIPLNDQARAAALSYTPETISEVDRQCLPYKGTYLMLAYWGFRMWPALDPVTEQVVAWSFSGTIDRQPTTIWMDGRQPPAATALSTPAGFTSGAWRGDTLVTTTTHYQDGLLTRNGVPASDQETFTMFLTKQDDVLSITGVIQDPVFLTAPYVLTQLFQRTQTLNGAVGAAQPSNCLPAEEVDSVLNGHVPSYLTPADNPSLNAVNKLYHIPSEATLGGEQTMYPEYADRLAPAYKRPTNYCTTDCCGTAMVGGGAGGFGFTQQVLKCK